MRVPNIKSHQSPWIPWLRSHFPGIKQGVFGVFDSATPNPRHCAGSLLGNAEGDELLQVRHGAATLWNRRQQGIDRGIQVLILHPIWQLNPGAQMTMTELPHRSSK